MKVKGQISENLYTFVAISVAQLIFGMCYHRMELQILVLVWSRSRSIIKVKGQIYDNFLYN